MRILSQDGLREGIIDVPYEQVSIEQRENEIWVGYSSAMQEHCVGKCFAKYSNSEKAQKAMEMLRDWKELRAIRNMPLSKDMATNSEFSKFIKKNFNVYVFSDEILKIDIEKTCEYFKFPADDEIEV